MTNEENNVSMAIAEWAHGLSLSDVPPRVVDEAKHQILNIVASIHAGYFSEAGRMTARPVKNWTVGKDATLIPAGEKTALHYAIFGNSALCASLAYDDYLLGARTGASTVVVALALGEALGCPGKDILRAQIVGNEIAGRIGLATTTDALGDQRSQAAHRVGSTMVGAMLYKLDVAQIRNALSLSLQDTGQAVHAGFISSDARILSAATVAPAGVQIAELAGSGLRGGEEMLGGDKGFCAQCGRPQAAKAFNTLGEIWLTETLCYSPYPCARHVAGAVECVLTLLRQHNFDARKVAKVVVEVSPDALEIESLAEKSLSGTASNPSAIAFSLRYAVAVALIDKELSPRQLTSERVRDEAVWELASRVEVIAGDAALTASERSLVRQLDRLAEGDFDLGRIDIRGLRAGLATKVRVRLKSDRNHEIQRDAPPGSGSGPFDDRVRTVEDKFRRETRYSLRKENMERAIDLIHHFDRATPANVKETIRAMCSER